MTKYYCHHICVSFHCPYCKKSTEEIFSEDWYVDDVDYPSIFICPHCKEHFTFDMMPLSAHVMTPMRSDDYVNSIEEIRVGVTSDNFIKKILNKRH